MLGRIPLVAVEHRRELALELQHLGDEHVHGRMHIRPCQYRRGGVSIRSRRTTHSSTKVRDVRRPTTAIGTSQPVGAAAPLHQNPGVETRLADLAGDDVLLIGEEGRDELRADIELVAFAQLTNGVLGRNGLARTMTPSTRKAQ